MNHYKPAGYKETAYNCPSCGAYSEQYWSEIFYRDTSLTKVFNLDMSVCKHCDEYAIWRNEKMLYPSFGGAPIPNSDMPEEVKNDFNEAREILGSSTRGSAALLRLGLQKLCIHLGEKGQNLNKDIGELVKKGLPIKIQKSLDIVRVIGKDAVHPGTIDIKDDLVTASKLFVLINIIVDVMITQPNEIDDLFDSLPDNKKKGILDRDK